MGMELRENAPAARRKRGVGIGAFLAHKFTPLSMCSLPPFFAACFFARGLFDGNGERLLSVMERDDSYDDCLHTGRLHRGLRMIGFGWKPLDFSCPKMLPRQAREGIL